MISVPVNSESSMETLGAFLAVSDVRLFSIAFPFARDAVRVGAGDAVDVLILGRFWGRRCLWLARNLDLPLERDRFSFLS
jgi:hypothetical protein